MNDSDVLGFGKFIPGFDFLQSLVKGQAAASKEAGAALGGLGNWVAPTVSEEELDKRIKELKAVLFWLEQNSTALKATIQALEVQKMTLATLAGMNMSMAEVAKAFTVRGAEGAGSSKGDAGQAGQPWPFGAASAEAAPAPAAAPEAEAGVEESDNAAAEPAPRKRAKNAASAAKADKSTAGAADPLQWWGALTQQFQQIATNALREAAAQVPPAAASGMPFGMPGSTAADEAEESPRSPKKPAAKKPNAQAKARKPATSKSTAKKAPTRKAGAQKAVAKKAPIKPAATDSGGWPLPPAFKLR